MRTLFLDLASHNGFLACVTAEEVAAKREVDHRIGDHELVPLIEHLLKGANWDYNALTHLACVIGPGGFTSLRVAVAAANALSWSLKIPMAGIHLSDLYKARMETKNFLWLHSTKKNELFARELGNANVFPEAVCVTLENLKEKLSTDGLVGAQCIVPLQWTGELIAEHRTLIDQLGLQPAALEPIENILPQFLATQKFDMKQLQPWYGRGW